MNLQEQYIYAAEVISMAYDHLQAETPSVDLTLLRECVMELQKEITCQNLLVCDNVGSEEEVNQSNKEGSLEGM